MTTQRPLTHLSIECIFQFMDPYLRVHLSQRSPAFQKMEKLFPLRIKSLVLGANSLFINDKLFEMRILKVFENGKVERHQRLHSQYLSGDVDRYGFTDTTDYVDMTAKAEEEEREREDLESLRALVDQYPKSMEIKPTCLGANYFQFRSKLAHLERRVQAYYLRENNLEPPFKFHFQLIMAERETGQTTELETLCYNKKVDCALSYFLSKFFRGRTVIIDKFLIKNSTVKLAFDLYPKLRIRLLTFESKMGYLLNALQLNGPLESLELPDDFQNYDHPHVKTAGLLIIKDYRALFMHYDGFHALKHARIHFPWYDKELVFKFITDWKDKQYPVGKHFSMQCNGRKDPLMSLAGDENKFGRALVPCKAHGSHQGLTLPLNESTELNFWTYAGKKDSNNFYEETTDLHFRIDPKGYAA